MAMFGWFSIARLFLAVTRLVDSWRLSFQMKKARKQGAKDQQLRSKTDEAVRKDKQAQAAKNVRRHTRSPRALADWLRRNKNG